MAADAEQRYGTLCRLGTPTRRFSPRESRASTRVRVRRGYGPPESTHRTDRSVPGAHPAPPVISIYPSRAIDERGWIAILGSSSLRALGRLSLTLGAERWGRGQSWLAVLFHHLTDGRAWRADDPYVAGLNLDMSLDTFADRIDSLSRLYEIVGLDDVLRPGMDLNGRRKRLLLCFDDAYASVVQLAAPILLERGLPWCFFINPGLVGNRQLAVDNFVAYVANTAGLAPLSRILRSEIRSANDVLRNILPTYTPRERQRFVSEVAQELGLQPNLMAQEARLYVERADVRALADSGVEIANHTTDHVHCRALDRETVQDQVVHSADLITDMTGRPVRGFAYPYGVRADATPLVTEALVQSGHSCAFLVHARTNARLTDRYGLFRISLAGEDDVSNALELEVLPRLRWLRARLSAPSGLS